MPDPPHELKIYSVGTTLREAVAGLRLDGGALEAPRPRTEARRQIAQSKMQRFSERVTSSAITVQEEFLIADSLRLMRMSGVRTVPPVTRGLDPVGILSFSDILHAMVDAQYK